MTKIPETEQEWLRVLWHETNAEMRRLWELAGKEWPTRKVFRDGRWVLRPVESNQEFWRRAQRGHVRGFPVGILSAFLWRSKRPFRW